MARVIDFTTRFATPAATSIAPAATLAGRLLLAPLFLTSGVSKVLGPGTVIGEIASVGLPFPELGLLTAITIELGGSAALVMGYQARFVAASMGTFSLATALLFHNRWSEPDQLLHFLKDLAIAGGLLQVVAFGAGRWSLDAWRMSAGHGRARAKSA